MSYKDSNHFSDLRFIFKHADTSSCPVHCPCSTRHNKCPCATVDGSTVVSSLVESGFVSLLALHGLCSNDTNQTNILDIYKVFLYK